MSESLLAALEESKMRRKIAQDKIAAIYERSPNEEVVFDELYALREDYNNTLAEADHLETQISSGKQLDPLNALPQEVWSQIIEDAIQGPALHEGIVFISTFIGDDVAPGPQIIMNLLLLTTVSRSWADALTSTPTLWTTTIFSEALQDYLALAETTLCLSKGCKIDLQLTLTSEGWGNAAHLVQRHRDRIHSLSIHASSEDAFTSILWDISPLPALKILSIRENPRIFMEKIDSFPLSRFPALQRARLPPGCFPAPWIPFVVTHVLKVQYLSQDDLGLMSSAPQLSRLHIKESGEASISLPGTFPPSLLGLDYIGPNTMRLTSLFPPQLTTLWIDCHSLHETDRVLQGLAGMLALQELKLRVSFERADEASILRTNETHQVSSQASSIHLRSLEIHILFDVRPERDILLDILYQWLHVAFPSAEYLALRGGKLTPALLLYIATALSLKSLTMVRVESSSGEAMNIDCKHSLQNIDWKGILSKTGSDRPFLQNLEPTVEASLKRVATKSNDRVFPTEIVPRWYLGNIFPFHPYIGAILSTPSTPRPFFSLSKLYIAPSHSWGFSTHARDLVEALVLRPYDMPGLSILGFDSTVVEWDIVILLLERRNISPPAGVSRVQIRYMHRDITSFSRRLEGAVLPLYSGKYSDREPLSSYSLDAIAARLLNRKQTGCDTCCHYLRRCAFATNDHKKDAGHSPYKIKVDLEGITDEYTLPLESRIAHPPLNRRDEQWLAESMERRRRYQKSSEKAMSLFDREFNCHGKGYQVQESGVALL